MVNGEVSSNALRTLVSRKVRSGSGGESRIEEENIDVICVYGIANDCMLLRRMSVVEPSSVESRGYIVIVYLFVY